MITLLSTEREMLVCPGVIVVECRGPKEHHGAGALADIASFLGPLAKPVASLIKGAIADEGFMMENGPTAYVHSWCHAKFCPSVLLNKTGICSSCFCTYAFTTIHRDTRCLLPAHQQPPQQECSDGR